MSPGVQRSQGAGAELVTIFQYQNIPEPAIAPHLVSAAFPRFKLFSHFQQKSINPKIQLTSVLAPFQRFLLRQALLKQLLTAGFVNYVTVPDELARIGPNQPISWSDCNTDSEDPALAQITLTSEIVGIFAHPTPDEEYHNFNNFYSSRNSRSEISWKFCVKLLLIWAKEI